MLFSTLLALLLFFFGCRIAQRENPPRAVWTWTLLALTVRIGAALLWAYALPRWGYGTEIEQAGYVMADAYTRDTAAWTLAQSEKPLVSAFRGSKADQYGGLLWLSAAIYRYSGGEAHQPLQMAVFMAIVATLLVPLGWLVTRHLAGVGSASWVLPLLALYPEAVLLGSVPMREAFLMPLAALALYGWLLLIQHNARAGGLWSVLAIGLALPISPPFAGGLAGALALLTLVTPNRWRSDRRLWAAFALAGALALAGMWFAWGSLAPEGVQNPLELASWWARRASEYQAYLARQSSGWLQKIFKNTPQVLHIPFLMLYGVAQPLLPAALIAGGAPIWWGIAIWRALGWTFALALLGYAGWRALWQGNLLLRGLTLLVWFNLFAAALRGGGDLWDNPRYRAMWFAWQAALMAWGWQQYRSSRDPWLRRLAIALTLGLLWFVPWYLRRYTPFVWYLQDVWLTLGAGLLTALAYILWDVWRTTRTR
ncbi:MAG: hypothetical protein OHK0052_01200 [Anaerolineales bacterium]